MNNRETILAFVERINSHDVEGLAELMTEEHRFIDPYGNEVVGRENMTAGWRSYYEMFPVYSIEVNEMFEHGDTFGMFGFAGGSFKGKAEASWRLPAAWKAIVKDSRVVLWQVYADTRVPFEAIGQGVAADK